MKDIYLLRPIGEVRVSSDGFMIAISEPYREALRGLDQFSHVLVFWWADRSDNAQDRVLLDVDLPYARGTKAGVFACRSESRPNPIALTTCALLNVDMDTGMVILPWIDALDKTPIIDLKPFIPTSDRVRDFHVAPWMSDWPHWMEEAGQFFQDHAVDFGD